MLEKPDIPTGTAVWLLNSSQSGHIALTEPGVPVHRLNIPGVSLAIVEGDEYVQQHIFTPLDMSHNYTSPAMAKQNDLAVGHQYWFA
jgi:hypothetical protein